MARILKALIILVISTATLPAQVKFLLDYNAMTAEYTVSMMPERTWYAPKNLTATGQVTLKATTGQFFVKEVKSYVAGTEWIDGGRVDSPNESPTYDYIFFNLRTLGLVEMPYRAFKKTKLFSFTIEANCAREVMLVSNAEDAFLPPNSRSVNIGNSLGALGANGEAYIGNVSDLPIFCPYANPPKQETIIAADNNNSPIQITQSVIELIDEKLLYPNPTINEVTIQFTWKGQIGQKDILVYNEAGELVRLFQQNLKQGSNNFTLDVSKLDNGIYDFLLVDKDKEQSLSLGKVIKIQ